MTINELTELLLKFKKVAGWNIKVYIRNYEEHDIQVFGILPEKNDNWEDVLVIE